MYTECRPSHDHGVGTDWLQGLVRAKRPERLPVVLTPDEVRLVLSELSGVLWLMASLMYGAGLCLLECAELRVKDVDVAKRESACPRRQGQKGSGHRDPARLIEPMAAQIAEVRRVHARDLRNGGGSVVLPDALTRKYPNAEREIGTTFTSRCSSAPSRQRSGVPG